MQHYSLEFAILADWYQLIWAQIFWIQLAWIELHWAYMLRGYVAAIIWAALKFSFIEFCRTDYSCWIPPVNSVAAAHRAKWTPPEVNTSRRALRVLEPECSWANVCHLSMGRSPPWLKLNFEAFLHTGVLYMPSLRLNGIRQCSSMLIF